MRIRKVPRSNLVINNKIYTRQELADTLGCPRSRIAAYIRDGLECCDEWCKDIWGKDLKRYAEKVRLRNTKAQSDELYCKHCGIPVKILNKEIMITEYKDQVSKSGTYKLLIKGKCETCGSVCVKFDWSNNIGKLKEHFRIVEALS